MNPTRRNRTDRGRSSRGQQSRFSSFAPKRGGFRSGRPKFNTGRPSRGNFRRGGSNRGGKKLSSFNPSQFININPVEVEQVVYKPKHTFETFGLDQRLVKTVHSMGIKSPTPIQDQIIPEILAGRDVIGLAETGTGKTAAFLLPLIEKNIKNPSRQTLILTPTRELALQIQEDLKKLSKGFRIFSVICVGGVNIRPQIRSLKYTNQFIIGTPGRLLDLLKRKHLRIENIKTVVLDEADRMLDMGFINDMRAILAGTPKDRETLFFSATMPADIKRLVHDFLRNPIEVSVKKKDVTNSIKQDVVSYKRDDKFSTLLSLLSKPEFSRVLIFGSMKHSVEKLSKQLTKGGVESESIHGNKNHIQRQKALGKFKNGEVKVLVATDVAARGIHVNDVSHVINYDLPNTFEDYVHRIGRTGRATKHGKALTFVSGR
jgi:superfamily II DNA/RNA helicase